MQIFSLLNGKVIVGGLALTLVAKAAMSFPELPMFKDTGISNPPSLVQTVAAKEKPPEFSNEIPPLVANLPKTTENCEAPEDVLISLNKERDLVAKQRAELENQRAEFALAQERLGIEKTSLTELKTMKPRTAAPILAKIPAVRARAVSKIILERSQLPGDQNLTGIKLK